MLILLRGIVRVGGLGLNHDDCLVLVLGPVEEDAAK